MSFVATFLIALLRVRTVNLSELATAFSGKAQTDSDYKRLQRLFWDFEIDYAATDAVIALMAIQESVGTLARPYSMAVWQVYLQYSDAGCSA